MLGYLNWDWEVDIKFNPQELGGEPYQVFFFLGSVPSSPSEWIYAPSRMFEPVTSHTGTLITEYRSINGVLEHHCGREIKDDEVLPYLRKNLSWRVKKSYTDEKIDNLRLKELRVVVLGPGGETPFGN